MYDQVTLKLNVDPLILSALKEDITSEDVSTNSVMPHPQAGEVDLICKEDGIICGLQVFERTFTLLDESTKVEFFVKDGDEVKKGDLMAKVYGDIRTLLSRRAHRAQLLTAHERDRNLYAFRSCSVKGNEDQTARHQKDDTEQPYF